MYQKHTWVSKEVIRREYLQNIEDGIYNEQERAIAAENALSGSISDETSRAVVKENALSASIAELTNNLTSETSRATAKENAIESALNDEIDRATAAETTLAGTVNTLSNDLSDETSRAITRENAINSALTTETTRATGAETQLQTNLTAEVARATQAEIDLHDYVDQKVSTTYKAAGSVYFADLPAPTSSRLGYVYNIKDDFVTTEQFVEGPGKSYGAGADVVITQVESGSSIVYMYDVGMDFIDLSNYVQKTDYATNTKAGVVKPDGTTITVDANGVLSSVGGGQGSAEIAEKMIAPIEADATESTHIYAIGSRLILNELLYEVIDDIAIGDALVAYEDDPTNANIKLSDDVTTMIKNKTITIDQTVTQGSANAVSGGAVYTYVDTMITQAISASY